MTGTRHQAQAPDPIPDARYQIPEGHSDAQAAAIGVSTVGLGRRASGIQRQAADSQEESVVIRVVHFLNQLFAGIEDKAGRVRGARWCGRSGRCSSRLSATRPRCEHLVCGAIPSMRIPRATSPRSWLHSHRPARFAVAGQVNAGRYGLACGAICAAAADSLGIPTITGLFPEAPAVDVYRSRTVIIADGDLRRRDGGDDRHRPPGMRSSGERLRPPTRTAGSWDIGPTGWPRRERGERSACW